MNEEKFQRCAVGGRKSDRGMRVIQQQTEREKEKRRLTLDPFPTCAFLRFARPLLFLHSVPSASFNFIHYYLLSFYDLCCCVWRFGYRRTHEVFKFSLSKLMPFEDLLVGVSKNRRIRHCFVLKLKTTKTLNGIKSQKPGNKLYHQTEKNTGKHTTLYFACDVSAREV